jgi:predicted membrane protein
MLCPPSLIYLVLSLIALVGSLSMHNMHMLSILASVIFILVWTWLLNFLCNRKLGALSWILLLLPIVLFLVVIAGMFEMMAYNKVKHGAANVGNPPKQHTQQPQYY